MISLALIALFVGIAAFHFYWAALGSSQPKIISAVIPSLNGKPAFTPSRLAAYAVGLVFLGLPLPVAIRARLIDLPLPEAWLRWTLLGMSAIFLLRAIGDFRLVGFFKQENESKFAHFDTLLYSPLCLGISICLIVISG